MSNPPAPAGQPTGDNTLALVSLLVGVGSFVPGIGLIAAPIALITGMMALRRSKGYAPRRAHRGMAIAGITLGSIALVLYLVVVLLFSLRPGVYRIF
ncbi:MAG TPA: DUF4190 domain-containing protein [Ktedonobacterales bacterium]